MTKLLILAFLCPFLCGSQPLTVGDALPDLLVQKLINSAGTTANLPLVRGRPLLICFFATWCGTCKKELPKLVEANRQYGRRLQVLLVTQETEEQFRTAQQKNSWWASLTLPVMLADSLLLRFFPYKYVPHAVWINGHGKIEAITGAEELSHANIQAFVSGAPLHLYLKKDVLDFNTAKPLLVDGNGGSTETLLFRTSFTAYLPGMAAGKGSRPEGPLLRSWYINHSVLSLYTTILGIPANRIVLEVADTGRYFHTAPASGAWKRANLYSYEQVAPASLPEEKRSQWAVDDLNRYLGIFGRYRRCAMACWVLVRRDSTIHLSTAVGKPDLKISVRNETVILQNLPLASLVRQLNRSPPAAPPGPIVLDETGIAGNVDLALNTTLSNWPRLTAELRRYGFDLLPAHRQLEVFVISETGTPATKQKQQTTNHKE